MEIRNEADAEEFYRRAPLPEAVDPFVVHDVERVLIERLIASGKSYGHAVAWVRARLCELASGWGLSDPEPVSLRGEGITAASALYLRRRWQARPLAEYESRDRVRYFDGVRWVAGWVVSADHAVPVRVQTLGGIVSVGEAVDLQLVVADGSA